MNTLKHFLPFLSWLKGYELKSLRADAIAGITVALVLVPQSMAYAQLAGLPPHYGLYAALLPPVVASLFGSSRLLATGPVAMVSLMTSATLEPLATAGSEAFVAYALLLALLVGVFQLALGVLRLGIVVNFLSHPVTNGFTNAGAIIIATSQLSKIFGVDVEKAEHHYETVYRVVLAALEHTHWPTLGMAVFSFAIMIGLRRISPRIPGVLVAVVMSIVLAWALTFESKQAATLAQIDSPRVKDLVNGFNEALAAKARLEELRKAGENSWHDLDTSGKESCLLCHVQRELGQFGDRGVAPPQDSTRPEDVLALHNLAGLLDKHLGEVKHSVAALRSDLRGLVLQRIAVPGQRDRFVLEGDSGPEAQASARWRLQAGNALLDPAHLMLSSGGAVVGKIPSGLPRFGLPHIEWRMVPRLIAAALIIALLGFMEAISIAKVMAARNRQNLDANQELVGQGLANILGCMAQSYAVSGSFSRSAVNLQAGGKTGISNVIASAVVMVVLLLLAPTLYHLPQAVLAAIIMMAVVGLLNVSGFLHAWRTSPIDGVTSAVTFVGTLVFAPHLEWGILIGVVLSLGAYLYRTTRPRVVALAPHSDGTMRDARRHQLDTCKHISVVSFEGALYFGSAGHLESAVLSQVEALPELRHLLIAANGIAEIDASGEETLRNLITSLRGGGCSVSISGLPEPVIDVLKRSHLYEIIGESSFYETRAKALAAIYASAHEGSEEVDCPFRMAMPPVVELSLHEDGSLRNASRHKLAVCRHIAVLRFDAPLNFANTSFLEQEILSRFVDRPSLRHILFVGHGINDIDALGADRLTDLVRRLKGDGFAVSFSGLKESVVDVLRTSQAMDVLGERNLYPTQLSAISAIFTAAHTGSSEQRCPYSDLAPRLTELSWHHTGELREVDRHHLPTCRHIAVLRLDGPNVLGNSKAIQSEFIHWAKGRPGVRYVVLQAASLHKLEGKEASNLLDLVRAVREADYRLVIAQLTDRAQEDLGRSGVADEIGVDNLYPTGAMAVASFYDEAHAADPEDNCPLRQVIPHLVELALHQDGSLRDARRHQLALCQRIVAVRWDGRLDYANIGFFQQELQRVLTRRPDARHILLAAHTLFGIDPIAAEEFCGLFRRLQQDGFQIAISGLREDESEVLRRTGKGGVADETAFYPTQASALKALLDAAHEGSAESPCPLATCVAAKS